MRNLAAKFGIFFDICKNFSKNLVDERGNMPRRGVVPRFSEHEVIAITLTAEQFGVDSESFLFKRRKLLCLAFRSKHCFECIET